VLLRLLGMIVCLVTPSVLREFCFVLSSALHEGILAPAGVEAALERCHRKKIGVQVAA
jgi:hypothetical protein